VLDGLENQRNDVSLNRSAMSGLAGSGKISFRPATIAPTCTGAEAFSLSPPMSMRTIAPAPPTGAEGQLLDHAGRLRICPFIG
jgi:hypothetical protein